MSEKINIVVLMAGAHKEFQESGYSFPKPLIEIANKPIAQLVVDNIRPLFDRSDNIVFVVRKEDSEKYYLNNVLNLLVPNSVVIPVAGDTAGAAITALLAIEEIDETKPLLIINGDQIIDANLLSLVDDIEGYDAGTVVFRSVHPRWSYVRCDKDNFVIEAAEKKPISDLATAGFYYYKKASSYIESVKSMILKDAHVGGVFYVCPVFNEMVLCQKRIAVTEISSKKYHSLMSPKMVAQYENYLTKA